MYKSKQISFHLENFKVKNVLTLLHGEHPALGPFRGHRCFKKKVSDIAVHINFSAECLFSTRQALSSTFNSPDQIRLSAPHSQNRYILQAKNNKLSHVCHVFLRKEKKRGRNGNWGLEGEQPASRRAMFPWRDGRRWCACSHRASKRSAELHTARGWHFLKSHVRMQPFPFAHKSAITCWQAGPDWPRALRISSQGWKVKREHVRRGNASRNKEEQYVGTLRTTNCGLILFFINIHLPAVRRRNDASHLPSSQPVTPFPLVCLRPCGQSAGIQKAHSSRLNLGWFAIQRWTQGTWTVSDVWLLC